MAECHCSRNTTMTMCLSEDDGGDGEEDCKFHGPAMDVILVVQNDGNDLIDSDDADDATNEDVLEKKSSNKGAEEIYFFQLKKACMAVFTLPKRWMTRIAVLIVALKAAWARIQTGRAV
mmetsp:Transcript_1412/g.2118  ORF Transcript_1412/g.2118 Transcript_1412/m.2118 type:complete len:119 (+) Transcript_1412:297-653(+)